MDNNTSKETVETEFRPQKSNISFEDFEKLDIRICKILSVEKVENTDKLYKMEIDTGIDKRIVVSAIAHQIKVDELLNESLPFVLNLEPRKIRGIESNAMIILGETVKTNRLFRIYNAPFDFNHCPQGEVIDNYLTGAIII
ncbi:MAG: hypothetical protein E6Q38_00885 [Crocinitomicaceae bacterium]|nr:MAG: hypothetical protein E6Q38_00885 [Crocinitomicaceae bacterium]